MIDHRPGVTATMMMDLAGTGIHGVMLKRLVVVGKPDVKRTTRTDAAHAAEAVAVAGAPGADRSGTSKGAS